MSLAISSKGVARGVWLGFDHLRETDVREFAKIHRFVSNPPILAKGSDILKKIEEFDFNSIKETIDTLDNDHKTMCGRLLNELLFMQVTLDELKKEIQERGVVTKMCQGKYDIERANPALNQYNTLMKNYSGCIKQLNELLPKETTNSEDDLDEFLNE